MGPGASAYSGVCGDPADHMSWEGSRYVGLPFEAVQEGQPMESRWEAVPVVEGIMQVVDEVTHNFVGCEQESREAKELG